MSINVTSPSLATFDELLPYLKDIWSSKSLTNNGKYHKQLEQDLSEYLGTEYISLVNNGTAGLILALKALNITGEVITTPYTFVATTHSILWNNATPVFVDIENDSFNIDPSKIEKLITEKTTAILAVHVYGIPCKAQEIQKLADKYNLKVIYDAAHAFGVQEQNKSILNYGDASVVSFHATKVFNTIEGGAVISNSAEMKQRIDEMRDFGFDQSDNVNLIGLNAKLNEMQAACGLVNLKYVERSIEKRRELSEYYDANLKNLSVTRLARQVEDGVKWNYSYYPILLENRLRELLRRKLHLESINVKSYFSTLVNEQPVFYHDSKIKRSSNRNAKNLADSILCLPLHPELSCQDINRIIEIIERNLDED